MESAYEMTRPSHIMGKTPGKRALYRNQEESIDSTVYHDYPNNKPFINDDYQSPPMKTVQAYPENNRQAVISALRNLQDKIHKLEIERGAAEENLKSLATETNKYRDILQAEPPEPDKQPTQTSVSKNNQVLESQLSAAETRCNLLEKQLDYMKKMVRNSEDERQERIAQAVVIERQDSPRSSDYTSHLSKISDLEREHLKLTANQSLAESKIRELEDRLREERQHRQRMVEKTAELESMANTNRYLMDEPPVPKPAVKSKRPKKKKKAVVSKKTLHPKADVTKHYRLNLADIPFVAGKNTGPSHHVGANVQRVLSMMKRHNTAYCSVVSQPLQCRTDSPSSGSSSSSIDNDLAELLLQLQDEFHQMSFEHQELSRQIQEAYDPRVREDLERELDELVTRMEAKSQQISKVRRHQQKVLEKKRKKKSSKHHESDLPPRPKSTATSYESSRIPMSPRHNGEVEVTTTIKTKGPGAGLVNVRPSSAREVSLNVLKDMKKLQTTLRKDDLSWE